MLLYDSLGGHKHLFNPDRPLMTDQKNDSTQTQLCKPEILLGLPRGAPVTQGLSPLQHGGSLRGLHPSSLLHSMQVAGPGTLSSTT